MNQEKLFKLLSKYRLGRKAVSDFHSVNGTLLFQDLPRGILGMCNPYEKVITLGPENLHSFHYMYTFVHETVHILEEPKTTHGHLRSISKSEAKELIVGISIRDEIAAHKVEKAFILSVLKRHPNWAYQVHYSKNLLLDCSDVSSYIKDECRIRDNISYEDYYSEAFSNGRYEQVLASNSPDHSPIY